VRQFPRIPIRRRIVLVALTAIGIGLMLGLPSAAFAVSPDVFTDSAASSGATTATVQGGIDPAGQSTTYAVEYDLQSSDWCTSNGSSGTPAHTTSPVDLGFSDNSFHFVSVDLTGLIAGTDYCAQLIATNGDGEGDGGTITWTQGVPSVTTFDAYSTGATTATLDGEVNPAGQSTTYAVEYDLQSSDWCTSSGFSGTPAHTTTATSLGSADTTSHDVSPAVSGLTAGVAYCGEITATNASGSSADSGQVDWTQGVPSADTFESTSTGASTANVTGDVDPAGQTTTYDVEYDLQSSDWCTSDGFSGTPAHTTTAQTLGFTDTTFHDIDVDLTGLTPGGSYCAEVFATNGAGTSAPTFQTTWVQGQPVPVTFDASSTSATTATVEGSVNPVGQATTYAVAWDVGTSDWCQSSGFSGSPANTTGPIGLGFTDDSDHDVSVDLNGLTAGTDYCAALVATNGSGSVTSSPSPWTQGTPVAFTEDALSTGGTTADVDGSVDPAGQSTSYDVQYDLASSDWCSSGGTSGTPANATGATVLGSTDAAFHDVTVGLTGLTPGVDYCAQLVASNTTGSGDGGQVEWTQGSPNADTFTAVSTGDTTAAVSGDVNPSAQSTTYQVVYDLASSTWCTSFGASGSPADATAPTTLGAADTDFHDVTVDLVGLTEGTSYCAAVQATNAAGTVDGSQVDWTQGAPSVDTSGAAPTGATTATVTGDVNPAGRATTYAAAYDLASSTWCTSDGTFGTPANTTTAQSLGSTDGTSHPVSVDVTGLTAGASYCGAIVATNVDGNAVGGQAEWTQLASTPQHTLTVGRAGTGSGSVGSSPAGISCGATCSHAFDQGTHVTLTATAAAGSVFAGWSGGGCAGTGTCQVTMSADEAVTATFDVAPPVMRTLTVSHAGNGTGTVTSSPAGVSCGATCSHAFANGTSVTLTATAASGSAFAGWSGGGCSGTGACTVSLSADVTVTATFAAAPKPPALQCTVPKLKGKTLGAAKAAITGAHCSVGRVTKAYSAKVKRGRVISQRPGAGATLTEGSKVNLTVSKGKKPKKKKH